MVIDLVLDTVERLIKLINGFLSFFLDLIRDLIYLHHA